LCTDGPVRTLVDLALAPEHRRGHGALSSGINHGRIDVARLRRALTGVPFPRAGDGRLVLAVDVSPWLRPDADTSSDRSFCPTFGRGLGKHQPEGSSGRSHADCATVPRSEVLSGAGVRGWRPGDVPMYV
jgi:hypothetical protein